MGNRLFKPQDACLLRRHRPRMVLTTTGAGVHPGHKAVTDIVTHGVFYARLLKWGTVAGGERLQDTEPHEIERFFFGHCRMEPAWDRFDFAVDASDVYEVKMASTRGSRARYSIVRRLAGRMSNKNYCLDKQGAVQRD